MCRRCRGCGKSVSRTWVYWWVCSESPQRCIWMKICVLCNASRSNCPVLVACGTDSHRPTWWDLPASRSSTLLCVGSLQEKLLLVSFFVGLMNQKQLEPKGNQSRIIQKWHKFKTKWVRTLFKRKTFGIYFFFGRFPIGWLWINSLANFRRLVVTSWVTRAGHLIVL